MVDFVERCSCLYKITVFESQIESAMTMMKNFPITAREWSFIILAESTVLLDIKARAVKLSTKPSGLVKCFSSRLSCSQRAAFVHVCNNRKLRNHRHPRQ